VESPSVTKVATDLGPDADGMIDTDVADASSGCTVTPTPSPTTTHLGCASDDRLWAD
jgi:hypothetical protein